MIWLIGNKGMLGTDMEIKLKKSGLDYIASDKEIDITDFNELKKYTAKSTIDWIINCSAYTAVDKAEDERDTAYKVNAEGVLNISKIAKEKGAKLIHISTDYVFSGDKNGEYIETDTTGPIGIYGKSKLDGEKYVIDTLTEYFIIRISWFFGIHGNNFVYTMLRLFKERDEVRIVSDQWGSPTYAIDVADLILLIIKNKISSYGIYHYTNEGRTNWYEFALEIFSMAKKYGQINREVKITPIKTEEYPTKAARPKNSYLSKEKIKKTLVIDIRSWQNALEEFFSVISKK